MKCQGQSWIPGVCLGFSRAIFVCAQVTHEVGLPGNLVKSPNLYIISQVIKDLFPKVKGDSNSTRPKLIDTIKIDFCNHLLNVCKQKRFIYYFPKNGRLFWGWGGARTIIQYLLVSDKPHVTDLNFAGFDKREPQILRTAMCGKGWRPVS